MVGLSTACAPRGVLLPALGLEVPVLREFPTGFKVPVSNETGDLVTGFGGGGGGVHRTPLILVHGNTVAPRYWDKAYQYLLENGYTKDEIWAVGYGWDTVRRFDSNDLSVPTIDAFVDNVVAYLSAQTGRQIHQVDIMAHSLGVTLVRQWMKQENAWHRVRNFAGVAGANHGVWTASADARAGNRTVALELSPGSPWLAQLNRGGETPGATRYLMLYDGTGWQDVLYPPWSKDSPALEGARNLAFNVEHGSWFDHLELAREPETLAVMLDFFAQHPRPPVGAEPPTLAESVQYWQYEDGGTRPYVGTQQSGARVYCAAGGVYPSVSGDASQRAEIQPGELSTCFAHNPDTGLSSPMRRYKPLPPNAREEMAGEVEISPPDVEHEYQFEVRLETDHPEAFIVYTTSGSVPDSGSPLYQAPIYVPGPVVLTARAIAPGGRMSEPIVREYEVSLDRLNEVNTLQRQIDADTPIVEGAEPPTWQEQFKPRTVEAGD